MFLSNSYINYVLNVTSEKTLLFDTSLQKMEETLPAFEKNFYWERVMGIKESLEELFPATQELLNDYDVILYGITSGKNYSKQLGIY